VSLQAMVVSPGWSQDQVVAALRAVRSLWTGCKPRRWWLRGRDVPLVIGGPRMYAAPQGVYAVPTVVITLERLYRASGD